MKIRTLSAISVLTASLALVGCEGMSNQAAGTLGGAALGGGAGAIIGNNVDGISSTEGAIAGALIGGLAGNVMGRQQDQINAIDARNNQYTVMVRNSNGSSVPVRLVRVDAQRWQGPRGEIYDGMPSESQLRRMYGN